jgi:DNA-binding CsgD family transcriptional regulator
VWYSYIVLHDAYVEGVPNREIMARLYISEGTFNRTRRIALRALARLLIEEGRASSKAN